MASKKVIDALNKQINAEIHSSYLYLTMSAYFETTPYKGMAKWMKLQSAEEYEHAMRIYDYVIRIGADVELEEIQKPKSNWSSPQTVFEAAKKHELFITDRINKIADLAQQEKDHATSSFIKWFVDEQVEEVATVTEIVEKFDAIGDSKHSLFWLDKELKKREEK
jgi:ferritin